MTGYEEQLLAHAEVLEDPGELVQSITAVLAGAQGACVDPSAVISLTVALQTLDPGAAVSYSAGSRKTGTAVLGTAPTPSSSRHWPMPRTRSGSTSAK